MLYLFFGVCTIVVNVLAYALLYEWLRLSNFWSSLLAWPAAVDGMHRNDILRKWVSSIIVTIVNYVAGKIFIFTKK